METEIKASSFTYEAAAKALGWRSDRRLRDDRKKGLLIVQVLGARTVQIKRHELVRYAREYGLTLYL